MNKLIIAELLVNSNYNTVEKIKNTDAEDLFNNIMKVNEGNNYFKGNIRLSDIQNYIVKDAAYISLEIEY